MGRLVYVVVCSAIVIAFLFGLRTLIYSQSHDFAVGGLFASAVIFGVLLAYRRFVGPID